MFNIKWATLQPLVGGMTIAAHQVLKTPPEFIITGFAVNDQECINYFNNILKLNIPVITMDPEYKYFITEKDEILFNKLNKNIELINYVPICSGLSGLTTNCSKCKVENAQNENQYNLTNFILKRIKPKVAVYENAPQLFSNSGKEVLEIIKDIAKDNSYSLTLEKTDTFLHGIPQHRQRTFVYFFNDTEASFIKYENLKPKPLIDYLKEIPDWAEAQDLFAGNINSHKDVTYEWVESLKRNNEEIIDVIHRYDNTIKWISGLGFLQNYTGFDNIIKWAEKKANTNEKKYISALKNYKRIKEKVKSGGRFWDDSCMIGTAPDYVNAVIWKVMKEKPHPIEDRPINLREYSHLMGMPHDWNLANWDDHVKISQNVPVSTSRHVARNCIDYINGNLEKSTGYFIKQNNIKQIVDLVEREKSTLEDW